MKCPPSLCAFFGEVDSPYDLKHTSGLEVDFNGPWGPFLTGPPPETRLLGDDIHGLSVVLGLHSIQEGTCANVIFGSHIGETVLSHATGSVTPDSPQLLLY